MAEGLTLVADSSAWIASYRPEPSAAKDNLVVAIRQHTILVPDVVLVEVLRGVNSEKIAKAIAAEFDNFRIVDIVGKEMALSAATNFRFLRSKGMTVRSTVDLLIATWCIKHEVLLLHADRDFTGFEKYLGLKCFSVAGVVNN